MKKEIDKYELIEQYLKGELSPSMQKLVADRISSDADFGSEVARQRQVFSIITDHSLMDIREQVRQIHINHGHSSQKGHGSSKIFKIIGAISIPAVIAIIILTNNTEKNLSNPQEFPTIGNIEEKIDILTDKQAVAKEQSTVNMRVPQQAEEPVREVTYAKTKPLGPTNEAVTTATDEPQKTVVAAAPNTQAITKTETGGLPYQLMPAPHNLDETLKEDTFNCSNTEIKADIKTEPSCENKATGKLIIDQGSLSGGEAPYSFSLNNTDTYCPNYVLEKLWPSAYWVYVKDNNNCISKLGLYRVNPKECSYAFAFAPAKGERWTVPIDGSSGNLKIFNKAGRLVFAQEFTTNEKYQWDGTSTNHEDLPMGMYLFVCHSNSGDDIQGTVTIIR